MYKDRQTMPHIDTHARIYSHLAVILVRPEGPINLGSIARLCANFGVWQLRLVAPVCDPQDVLARQFALRGSSYLSEVKIYQDLASASADLLWRMGTTARRRKGSTQVGLAHEIGAEAYSKLRNPSALDSGDAHRLGLVLGPEASGLSSSEIEQCDALIRFELGGPLMSINLSHAAALALYGLGQGVQQIQDAAVDLSIAVAEEAVVDDASDIRATAGQRGLLQAVWLDALEQHGFFRRASKTRFAGVLAALMRRWDPCVMDVHRLMGMFKHLGAVRAGGGDRAKKPKAKAQRP